MTRALGSWLVWSALAAEVAAAFLFQRRRVRAGGRCLLAGAASAGAAVAALGWALVTNDFSIAYVADQSTRAAAAPYRLAGLWGGMAGSLLLWSALLAALGVIGTSLAQRRLRDAATAGTVLAGVAALFTLPLVAVTRPFDRLAMPALDGGGLAPVLEHPAMLYHPPLLYLGYAGLAVPFALAVAGLASGRVDQAWLDTTRGAALATWGVLTAGIAAGAHWAYAELGWGGFWAWDPVENAALMPWLVTTAFLHNAAVDARRGRTRLSTAALPVAAFALAAFGAVLTRSGAAVSVHAFAEARAVGWLLLGAWLLVIATGAGAVVGHARRAATASGSTTPRSRLQQLVTAGSAGLLCVAGVVFVGTALPVLEGLFVGSPRVVDPWYFAMFCGPIAAAVVAALIVAEVLGRRAPRRRWRVNPGAIAHAGILLVAVGVAGSALGTSDQVALGADETARVGGVSVRVERFLSEETERGTTLAVDVEIGARGDEKATADVRVELRQRSDATAPQSEAAVVSTPLADVLVVPRLIDAAKGVAVLDVHRRPLVLWIWVGAALLVTSAAFGLLRRRRPHAASSPAVGRWSEGPPVPEGWPLPERAAPPTRPAEPAPPVVVPGPGR